MAKRRKTSTRHSTRHKAELLVRELTGVHSNTTTIAPAGSENSNNIARFFNDTPYNLELVAVKLTSMVSMVPLETDVAQNIDLFSRTELSRQAIINQQEGIVAMVSGRITSRKNTVATGGLGGMVPTHGEMLFGDFEHSLATLNVQETLFVHSEILSQATSIASLTAALANNVVIALLWFRIKSTGY